MRGRRLRCRLNENVLLLWWRVLRWWRREEEVGMCLGNDRNAVEEDVGKGSSDRMGRRVGESGGLFSASVPPQGPGCCVGAWH